MDKGNGGLCAVLIDKAPELTGLTGEELEAQKVIDAEEHITAQELEEIETALEEIAEHKQLNIERDELQDLKQEVNEYKEVGSYFFFSSPLTGHIGRARVCVCVCVWLQGLYSHVSSSVSSFEGMFCLPTAWQAVFRDV